LSKFNLPIRKYEAHIHFTNSAAENRPPQALEKERFHGSDDLEFRGRHHRFGSLSRDCRRRSARREPRDAEDPSQGKGTSSHERLTTTQQFLKSAKISTPI
jgi:hypothetical protein